MKKLVSSCLAYALLAVGAVLASGSSASAQTAILQELYGRGVHAYYAGDYTEAYELLSTAIDNGIEDPRAYYFRGIVAHATGRPEQAEGDWHQGAQLEAAGKIPGAIGPALARFQGPARLKLEQIRDRARLEAMSAAAQRREQLYGPAPAGGQAQQPQQPAQPQPQQPAQPQPQQPAQPQPAQPQQPIAPPPTPPQAGDELDNPFADDTAAEPEVESQDALEGAMDAAATPPAEQPADRGQSEPAGDDPFGAGDDQPAGEDPFGGDGGGDDPFGGDGGGEDPFGGDDPFGGGEMEDPFG